MEYLGAPNLWVSTVWSCVTRLGLMWLTLQYIILVCLFKVIDFLK